MKAYLISRVGLFYWVEISLDQSSGDRMNKIQGRGGWLKKDGVLVTGIQSFSFEETDGEVHNQKGCIINVVVYVDSSTPPYRKDDEFDVQLGHNKASWTITAYECRVVSAPINFNGGEAMTQPLTLNCVRTPVIA